jgi:hypothetical protein
MLPLKNKYAFLSKCCRNFDYFYASFIPNMKDDPYHRASMNFESPLVFTIYNTSPPGLD